MNINDVRESATILPRPCKLTFDLLTLKVESESRVTWVTCVPSLIFLGLSVLELFPMYATNRQTDRRQTSDRQTSDSIIAYCPRLGGGGIKREGCTGPYSNGKMIACLSDVINWVNDFWLLRFCTGKLAVFKTEALRVLPSVTITKHGRCYRSLVSLSVRLSHLLLAHRIELVKRAEQHCFHWLKRRNSVGFTLNMDVKHRCMRCNNAIFHHCSWISKTLTGTYIGH